MSDYPSIQRVPRATAVALSLFLLALLPRLVAIGRYITPDELIWVYRTVQFREALLARDWGATLVAGHPGVTTTWLAALGMTVQMAISAPTRAAYDWVTRLAYLTPDNMAALHQLAALLTAGRLAVALVLSAGVALAYLLARRAFNPTAALVFALILALDPFVAGLSGLLHVDALMTAFTTLALLALMLMIREGRPGWAALAGALTALAIISKSPALLLVPFAGLALLLRLWRVRDRRGTGLLAVFWLGCAWLAALLLTALVSFPALWAAPADVFATLTGNASRHVEEALRPTFFLGRVAFDHGPLFYPVALAWRLSPVVFAGLVALLVALWRDTAVRRNLLLWFGLLWPLLYVAAITVAAKKFDRYALPAIPLLALATAVAWTSLVRSPRRLPGVVAAILVLYLLPFGGYPLAAYNPLVGGPWTAVGVMPLGWGESISAGGRWLAGEPGAAESTAVSGIAPSLAPFFPGQTLLAELASVEQADYVLVTANSYQTAPEAMTAMTRDLTPVRSIRYGFLEQGQVFANPAAVHPAVDWQTAGLPATFDGRMRLAASALSGVARDVDVFLRWERLVPDGRYTVRLRMEDATGQVWSMLETDLLNETYFYPVDWQPDERPEVRYRLDLPQAMPPGDYSVTLALVESESNGLLAIAGPDAAFEGTSITFAATALGPVASPPDPAAVAMDQRLQAAWLDGRLRLLGASAVPPDVESGGRVPLTLFWQGQGDLPAGLQAALLLGDTVSQTAPLSRFDTAAWRAGELIEERLTLPVPPDLAPGSYALRVQPLDVGGRPLPGTAVALGEIEVRATDRLFALPQPPELPLDVAFASGMRLLGLDGLNAPVRAGEPLVLTLAWETAVAQPELLTAFVHLLGPDDQVLAQSDQWPGGLPSVTWAPGQVIVDGHTIALPADLPPGDYRLAVGLYLAEAGVRLPLQDTAVEEDRFILPAPLRVGAPGE